jgi:hypothetical protein
MDVQTYLNRQNDQLRMQRTIESITPSQEDIDLRPAPHTPHRSLRLGCGTV